MNGPCSGPLLNRRQAAAYLGLPLSSFAELHARRELPFVQIGRRPLYPQPALDEWIARRVQQPVVVRLAR